MISSGSGYEVGKVSVPVPATISDPNNVFQSFSTATKLGTQSCLFNVMNSGSGSANAKSYCSLGSDSSTLPSRALPVGVLAMFVVQLYVELGNTHSAEDHLSVAAT
jgi:hypothetical protein